MMARVMNVGLPKLEGHITSKSPILWTHDSEILFDLISYCYLDNARRIVLLWSGIKNKTQLCPQDVC